MLIYSQTNPYGGFQIHGYPANHPGHGYLNYSIETYGPKDFPF